MKNKKKNKRIATVISILLALTSAVVFWLVTKYVDYYTNGTSPETEDTPSAYSLGYDAAEVL